MANFANLKAAINAVIKQNGQGEITGEVMNQVLTAMVNSLGSNYQFAGVATPSTNPGTPDQNVFYMATQAGTYTNFSAIVLQAGISILLWDGSWSSETFFTVDSVPTAGSNNFITSGAVFDKMKLDGGAYDVTAHNNNATFADLSALLNSENLNTLIPVAVRHGGMSIKFVQSSDNKYVQFCCMSDEFTTDVTKWSYSKDVIIIDNPEYLWVRTDVNGRVLLAITGDGNVYFGYGVPKQIVDYINDMIGDFSPATYDKMVTFLDDLIDGNKTLDEILDEIVEGLVNCNFIIDNYFSGYIYINTTTTPNTTTLKPTTSSTHVYAILPCKEGDKFKITGTGEGGGRLFFFADKNLNILYATDPNYSLTNYVATAPANAVYVVFNFLKENTYQVEVINPRSIKENYEELKLSSIAIERGVIDAATGIDLEDDRFIRTTGYIDGYVHITAPDGFLVNAVQYYDELDYTNVGAKILKTKEAYIGKHGAVARIRFAKPDLSIINSLAEFKPIENFDRAYNHAMRLEPVIKFDINHEVKDLSDDVSFFNMTTSVESQRALMSKLYEYCDRLCALYPSYITKYDPMAESDTTQIVTIDGVDHTITIHGMSDVKSEMATAGYNDYPVYAKGINEPVTIQYAAGGDTPYNVTYNVIPEYKTYLYKLADSNSNAGNNPTGQNRKRNLFLMAGTHGTEAISMMNVCIFGRLLCEGDDFNYFALRQSFNVWILPCLNGYGTYYETYYNANKVNIDWNFPTLRWEQNQEAGDAGFSGYAPATEFETHLAMTLVNYINPDVAVDHHSYHGSARLNFYIFPYTESIYDAENFQKLSYQSLCDFSFTAIKEYPERFGNTPKLFLELAGASPSVVIPYTGKGISARWFANNGVEVSLVIEANNGVNYKNGELLPANSQASEFIYYSNTAFSLAEYTLRTDLLHFCQYALDTYKINNHRK